MKTYYGKKIKRRRLASLWLVFIILLVSFLFYFVYVVSPVITESTRAMVFSSSSSAVSDAVYEVLGNKNISYEDIVSVRYDSGGGIEYINVDTVAVNSLVREMYALAQQNLNKMGKSGIDIAIGTFSGIPAFVGLGPSVNVRLVTIGAITASFSSNFKSAGINQTNHTISVKFKASVSLVLPVYSKVVDSDTEILIADEVIVGKIPNVYLDGSKDYAESINS